MRIIFYSPKFAPRVLLLKLSNLNSVEAEVDIKKLLFLGRFITQADMAETVESLFLVRVGNYFDSRFSSLGAIPSICETLRKYDLFQLFENWFTNSIFPTYSSWKKLVKAKVCESEERIWAQYCLDHPSFQLPKICLDSVNSHRFWSIAKDYPDLVSRLHAQARLMCNFGLNAGVPWPTGNVEIPASFARMKLRMLTTFPLRAQIFV